jgi:ribosomal protein S18 acetylase RimI-like enzyme
MSADQYTITAATLNDLPRLSALVNRAYRGDSSRQGWTTEADLLDGQRTDEAMLREQIEAPGARLLLYHDAGGALLGCVYLQHLSDALYLGMLTVEPTAQGQGIGKRLLGAADALALALRVPCIRITVISARHDLLAWYERHGFRRTGREEPFHTDPRFGLPRQPLSLLVLEKPVAHSFAG